MSSALSHQWFVQWTRPLPIFPEVGGPYSDPRTSYSWVNFHPHDQRDGARLSGKTSGRIPGKDNVEVRESEERIRGFKKKQWQDRTRYNGGLRVLGAAMWLSGLAAGGGKSYAPGQMYPADSEALPFYTLYKWGQIDFEFPSAQYRDEAIATEAYIPENVLPLGIEVWQDRVFVTVPSWKRGLPATLGTVPRAGGIYSPLLRPYPDWTYHRYGGGNCSGLTSVFRVSADQCGRLWVLDSGQVEAVDNPKQLCPPAIVVFDLKTDRVIARYNIPERYVLQNSLYSTIVTDIRSADCSDTHVYITDTWRFGLLVFREADEQFWRFSHHLFYPDPVASNFTLHGVNFQWSDGIFGLSLTPLYRGDRTLFFHAMSSYREFYVKTSIIRNYETVNKSSNHFHFLGESRGDGGQVSAAAIDRRGVMFYNLVSRDSVGCWSTRRPYLRKNLGVVATNYETMIFPNDLKIDQEPRQSVWIISNRLPMYQMGPLDPYDYNFRIMYADVEEAVRGTECDPTRKTSQP